jgi:hypothetical protein
VTDTERDAEFDAEFDAHLDDVIIGERAPRPIVLVEYDDSWPEQFEQHRFRIGACTGWVALRSMPAFRSATSCAPMKPTARLTRRANENWRSTTGLAGHQLLLPREERRHRTNPHSCANLIRS